MPGIKRYFLTRVEQRHFFTVVERRLQFSDCHHLHGYVISACCGARRVLLGNRSQPVSGTVLHLADCLARECDRFVVGA